MYKGTSGEPLELACKRDKLAAGRGVERQACSAHLVEFVGPPYVIADLLFAQTLGKAQETSYRHGSERAGIKTTRLKASRAVHKLCVCDTTQLR